MTSVIKASGWSILTEFVAKVISPISFLVLTRILSPDDFGKVAIATTFLSFIFIISDLGISKVVIQESFNEDDIDKSRALNTCFSFNLLIGGIITVLCITFSNEIAQLFGSSDAGPIIRVMSIQIILYSLSSIHNSLLKKTLNFKFLFYLRMVTIAMPILISIPIALLGGGYWAIVWGNLIGAFLNCLILWKFNNWRPKIEIDKDILKRIVGKGIWGSFDEILVWLPLGLDVYLIGNYFSAQDLGLYSTSRTLFSAAISITLGAILPVLFSHFSNIKNDEKLFFKTIFFAQKLMYLLAGMLGVSVFLFSGLIENIFFNDKWKGISGILGIVFFIMSNGYFYSVLQEALRSRGYFRQLFSVKFISIFFIVPVLFLGAQYDIYIYTIIRCLSLYIWIIGIFYWSRKLLKINLIDFVKNSLSLLLVVFILFLLGIIIDNFDFSFYMEVILKGLFFAFGLSYVVFQERDTLKKVLTMIKIKGS